MNELGLAGLIGIFLPLIISLGKQVSWPRWANVGVAVVISIAGGVVTTATDGNINLDSDIIEDPEQLLAAAAACFAAATVVYQSFLKGSGIDNSLTSFPNG